MPAPRDKAWGQLLLLAWIESEEEVIFPEENQGAADTT